MSNIPMNDCRVIQVIRTTLSRRGTGKDRCDPVRCVTQYWTLDGQLLWEEDPLGNMVDV